MWDVKIRQASGGKRNIGDLFRNLMKQTDSGARKYTWTDIKAALHTTADSDWEDFYQAHIRGREPLPLDKVFPLAGLRIDKSADDREQIVRDTSAPAEANRLWRGLVGR
jgi:predicted metalloprotease with PDZ domain